MIIHVCTSYATCKTTFQMNCTGLRKMLIQGFRLDSTKQFFYIFHIDLEFFTNSFGQLLFLSHISNHYFSCRTHHAQTKYSKKQGGHVSYKKNLLSGRHTPNIFCLQQWHGLNESRLFVTLTCHSKLGHRQMQMP